ncbi:Autophagy protein 5 [Eumeta japonica]|uniref:Autophagy protein 5 n=1 Tax=Eumeta variegata TaxID=151549 RepID=A0A4C1XW59_EUMVA|nr:Autophagy protein 5 [Eumeta japonica]
MANDREVLREIWDGKLPVCFQLDQDEITEIQQPDPFYVMVPRLSYFPLVTDKRLCEAHYMSCVKEADMLKHRGQVMSTMQKKDHNQLWLGLQNDKFDQFWAINRRLMESHGDQDGFKHIPLRIYSDDGTFVQRLISPKNNDGSRKTLKQMLLELYPNKSEGN